ncbi:unnamed protein product [Macrosiphum euphorbiae]|uniref:DUF5641 domain-containing protein n=1 Tax=Macrosiphum euphorbiae TaxID=13131 RepID=A0AAV0WF33_9HEMI|nr:unnamed protein product [Macrosiphum euphorbiae]
MKYLLRRVLDNANFTYEELLTILTHAAFYLNSRPLPPNDLIPSHFLIGDSLTAIPETHKTSLPINRLNRWCWVSQYSQNMWKRWGREYLSQLQERANWESETSQRVKVGFVVLLKDDHLPSLRSRMGRVGRMV